MKRALAFTGCLLFTSGMILAQEQRTPPPEGFVKFTAPVGNSLQEGAMISSVVKGAPFTAQQTTETSQTLSDGTHISRTNSVTFTRDSQGRTRREDSGLITINDSVAGVSYRLEKNSHAGLKTQLSPNAVVTFDGKGGVYSLTLRDQAESALAEQKLKADAEKLSAIQAAREKQLTETTSMGSAEAAQEKMATDMNSVDRMKKEKQEQLAAAGQGGRGGFEPVGNKNESEESLGSQNMEGVLVDGTRTTVVIPVGQIGNDRPISIVTDRWYCPELHIYVLTRHTDPRSGETITKYTGIQREEPDSALFQVPAGYTIRELPKRVIGRDQ